MQNPSSFVLRSSVFLNDKVNAARDVILRCIVNDIPFLPRHALITGSGLDGLSQDMKITHELPYSEIPYFLTGNAPAHAQILRIGQLYDRPIIICQGRTHLYEGAHPADICFPIRVLKALGIENLIITNAAGALNPDYRPTDIMCLTDHINLSGHNPLVPHSHDCARDEEICFTEMGQAYCPLLLEKIRALPSSSHTPSCVHYGVYAGVLGPSLETPAERKALQILGADAVGMSSIMECIMARTLSMNVLGLSAITNMATPDAPPITVQTVLDNAAQASTIMRTLIRSALQ